MCCSHNIAIVWKQRIIEDSTIDNNTSIMDEPFVFEEIGLLAAKHYRNKFAIHNISINLNLGLYQRSEVVSNAFIVY